MRALLEQRVVEGSILVLQQFGLSHEVCAHDVALRLHAAKGLHGFAHVLGQSLQELEHGLALGLVGGGHGDGGQRLREGSAGQDGLVA